MNLFRIYRRSIHSLRPYQKQCIDVCINELNRGVKRQVVSLPVGSGKTVLMAALINQIPAPHAQAKKTLILAHRQELLTQAFKQIQKLNPDLRVELECSDQQANVSDADVIVASIQSLGTKNSTRIAKYVPSLFKSIMIDEAHHAAAATYTRILHHFGALEPSSHLFLWGCSATVMRHDGLKLGDIFDEIVYHYEMKKMITENWYYLLVMMNSNMIDW